MTKAIQSSLGGVLATGTAIDTVECQSIFAQFIADCSGPKPQS
jgi:hypothetical protein